MPYVTNQLTAAAASVVGTPTPTRSWQWLRGSTLISGATSSTYTVSEDDIGSTISVRQIETNIAGVDTATSAATAAVQAFDPIALFGAGEEGAWYDPSDLSTLYQDSWGTTPVTGTGQPVGRILDKSKGLTLGSELIGAAKFVGPGWTDNGDGSYTAINTNGYVTTYTPLVTGKTYRVTLTISGYAGGNFRIGLYGAYSPMVAVSNGTLEYNFQAGSPNSDNALFWGGSFTGTISNISVKELPGNHATQSTSTARPTLAATGTTPATLGSELVTNGTFDTDTDWTKFNATISGGQATMTTGYVQQGGLGLVAGRQYKLTWDVVSTTSSTMRVYCGTTSSVAESIRDITTGAGSYSAILTAGTVGDFVRISGGNGTTVYDNITVQEVLTWADPKYYLDFDGVDDRMGALFASVQAQPNTALVACLANVGAGYIYDSEGSGSERNAVYFNSSSTAQSFAGTGGLNSTVPINNAFVINSHYNSNFSTARVDGVLTLTANAGALGSSGISLGSRYSITSYLNGRIYGFINACRTLTTAEIEATESYLATKSGVTLDAGGDDGGDIPLDGGNP